MDKSSKITQQPLFKKLFKNSIGSQLFISLLAAALIGLGGMAYFFYHTLENREENSILLVLNTQVQSVEEQILQVERLAFNMIAAVRIMQEQNIKEPEPYKELVLELFERQLTEQTSLMAIGFGQEPHKIVSDRKFFWPYFSLDTVTPEGFGRTLPAPHDRIRYVDATEIDGNGDGKPDGDYRINHYYEEPVAAGTYMWLKPFLWYGVTYTTYCGPIFDKQQQLLGAMAADLNVTALSQQFNIPVIKDSGYFIIISKEGNLLAYPPDPQQAIDLSTYQDVPILKTVYDTIGNKDSGIVQVGGYYWAYQQVEGIDWRILAVVPKSVVLRPVLSIAIGGTTGAGAILALVVLLFVRRLNRRLQPILEECQKIAREDTQKSQENHLHSNGILLSRNLEGDEIDILNQSFNQMASQLKSSFELLEDRVKERTAQLEVAKGKAEVANQAKSAFIANMSHELRSPLNAILGFAQIMTRSQTLPKEHQDSVSIINRSGEHLLTLINNVLDLSKIEAGRITLNEKNFDLHRLLDDIHDMFQLKATDKGLQLLLESTDNLPRYIRTDEVKLRQILINLINNALKFTQQGGISIRTSQGTGNREQGIDNNPKPTTLYFEIEDTGPGIASEELDKLFEAFSQTASGKQAQEGTGLGLSISRKFVQLMGGEMQVKSQVGEGTIFSFEVKVEEVSESDVETHSVQHRIIALEPGQDRDRILIVDDKPVNRQLLIQLLNPLGFELQEASNGQEAIETWEQWQPHLIWMDMRMPVMNGFEATQKIKATPQGKETVIIALTASVMEEERAVVLSAGCDDFLRKPFRDEQIFQAMERNLGVRFIYEEAMAKPENDRPKQEQLTLENIQALPPQLQLQLRHAVLRPRKREVAAVVQEIEAQNPAFAEAIATCFQRYEYNKILALLPQEEDLV